MTGANQLAIGGIMTEREFYIQEQLENESN